MKSASQGPTYAAYLLGFVISIVLTSLSFGLAIRGGLSPGVSLGLIFLLAIVQILTQLHFFLHLDAAPEQRWAVIPLLYTLLIVGILVGGSLWIMYNTGAHMM